MPFDATTVPPLPYSVNLYGSHPNLDNDDCWTGDDYATLEAAQDAYDTWATTFPSSVNGTTHVRLMGPDLDLIKQVVSDEDIARAKRDNERELEQWRREQANEAGMMGGCDAYNEAMGWD